MCYTWKVLLVTGIAQAVCTCIHTTTIFEVAIAPLPTPTPFFFFFNFTLPFGSPHCEELGTFEKSAFCI